MSWALELRATSDREPGRLTRLLSALVVASDGWVLGRAANGEVLRLSFEFERRACLEVYAGLLAAGIELTRDAHLRLTELCQCTRTRPECGTEIATIELEVLLQPRPWAASLAGEVA